MHNSSVPLYNTIKRVFDVVFASILIILLSPLLVIIYTVIFFETGMNPVFTQQRGIVLERPRFKIYKFRTLRSNCLLNNINQHEIFLKDNLIEAVTVTGYILRKAGLDELPQLINILRGEMSFIGPRPLSIDDLIILKKSEPLYYERRSEILSRPGISGYWQIFGCRLSGTKNLVECEEEYEKAKSFSFDIFLILMTIPIILFGKHYDSIINGQIKKIRVPQYLINYQKREG
ncbi:MAG: sugar transferase [Ignavibacteriaceae bacterium]